MSIVRKQFTVAVKSVDEVAHTVTALVSNPGLDRDGERILPTAFKQDLEQFKRNAVHLWGHDATALENVLGRAVSVEVTPDGLLVTFEYAVDANPNAAVAFNLVKAGALSAYSVGFIPVEWVTPSDTVMPEYRDAKRVYTRVRLVEISLVAIPSNPEALVVGRQLEAEPERSNPMNPHLSDAVARLRAAADTLEAGGDAECAEAVSAVCTAVAADLLAYSGPEEETEEPEEVEEPEEGEKADAVEEPAAEEATEEEQPPKKSAKPRATKGGAVLSSANRKRLSKIYKTCKAAMEDCKAMAAEAGHDVEADDDEKSGDGRDNGDGVGATNHEPTPEEQNAGKSFDLAAWWEQMKKQ